MENKIAKIQILSNNIAFGPEPLSTDEVEQLLTIRESGEVSLEAFIYASGFNHFKPSRRVDINIGTEATKMIFDLIETWTISEPKILATDVGYWEMTITDCKGKRHSYTGALIYDLTAKGVSISDFIRKCVRIDDLFVFDGNEPEEADEDIDKLHQPQRQDAELIVSEFLDLYRGYGLVEYANNCNELVVIVADTVVFYIKYDIACNFMSFEENRAGYLAEGVCGIDIEELTPNLIMPKYQHAPFLRHIEEKLKIFTSWIRYGRFRGVNQHYLANGLTSQTPYVIEHYPAVKLKERLDAWQGNAYNIVVFEMNDSEGNTSYAADAIKGQVHPYVLRIADRLASQSYEYSRSMGFGLSEFNHILDKTFIDAFRSHKGTRLVARLQENLKYFSFNSVYIREEADIRATVQKYLDDVKSGKYKFVERIPYSKPEYRWKTEEYVYKIIKKLYKEYGVIYQHRPFFLHSSTGGQMSYDIFISGLNVAIEYQGKQHFEPVDYFGGEDSFKKLQKRDAEKKKLSQENGVKLVYINYWEDVTPELIQQRVEQSVIAL